MFILLIFASNLDFMLCLALNISVFIKTFLQRAGSLA